MKRLGIALTALGLACTSACGGLPNDEGAQSTLVTLRGQVQSTAGALSGSAIHVAMVWENGNEHALAVDVPVQPEFPAGFKLPIKSPPPSDFVVPDKDLGNAKAAWGGIIAYTDDNKNGKLDLLNENSTAYIDHVVGLDKTHIIVFFGSPPPTDAKDMKLIDKNGASPHTGFNMMLMAADGSSFTWVPLTTDLVLTADDSSDAQIAMCASGSASSGSGTATTAPPGVIGPNNQYPDPSDPNLICYYATSPDEYGYTVDKVTVSRPCYTETTSITTVYSKDPGTSPPGWPCP